MQIGYLYQKNEKEVQKDIEKGAEVTIGIDCNSLLDKINILEIENISRTDIVVALLKQELMEILGKIIVQREEKKQNEVME
jgi:hypothetical protein